MESIPARPRVKITYERSTHWWYFKTMPCVLLLSLLCCLLGFFYLPRMAEESREGQNREKPMITIPNPSLNDMKTVSLSSSVPSSPIGLRNAKSLRNNCLCSPTTHAGSFRCRYHRNPGLMRNSMSVGSKLSELGANNPVGSKHPELVGNSST